MGVRAVGGNRAAVFVMEKIQQTKKRFPPGCWSPWRGVCDCKANVFDVSTTWIQHRNSKALIQQKLLGSKLARDLFCCVSQSTNCCLVMKISLEEHCFFRAIQLLNIFPRSPRGGETTQHIFFLSTSYHKGAEAQALKRLRCVSARISAQKNEPV